RVIRHEFVGRVDKLQELLERLQPGKTITICGPGGIGKSSLAAKAVWTLAPADQPPERFPDGIITHSFLERPEAATAFELIASAYKEVPQPDWATAAQRAMANRRALLVLDDAEAAQDLPSLLNRTGLCGVLITTRRREDAPDQNAVMDLPPLAPEEATTLLKKLAGARALDEDAVAQICHLVGYLPFSINFVGRYLHSYGINATEYLSSLELNDEADQTIDERQRAGIAHLFNRTITYISDLARQTLGVIGVLAQAPFEHSLIESVLEIKSAYHTLGELVNYSFLERGDTSYKVAHALIRTYAQDQLPVPDATLVRLAHYYESLFRGEESTPAEQEQYRSHVMHLLKRLVERQRWQAILPLAHAIQNYLSLQGHWTNQLDSCHAALQAARAQHDQVAEADWLYRIGGCFARQTNYEQAFTFYESGLEVSRAVDYRQGVGVGLG
ncbi:MAG: hypothetical protein KDE58_18100, partial [Caldilineaceae bacterium]|nr:hypothetical protein [Caldilineaceae bacterium]